MQKKENKQSNVPLICASAVLATAVGSMVCLICYYHKTLTKIMAEDDGDGNIFGQIDL